MPGSQSPALQNKLPKRRVNFLDEKDEKLLLKHYTKGPAAYGSVKRLSEESGLPPRTVKLFLHKKGTHTKYRNAVRRFPRLKVLAFEINEIWSLDLAYVDKLSEYNNGIKYLLIAVDVLSRYLRVQPLKSKTAKATATAFAKMLSKQTKPEKVWTDKGTEFKGAFQTLCKKKNIKWYTTQSETKSLLAERNIRSLKTIIYKFLEEKWTYSYINSLPEFVKTINTRVNRVTKVAPAKFTKKEAHHLNLLTIGDQLVRKPKFRIGDTVRISKEDLPFRKGYKQTFTDEIFTIISIPTVNPPTYNLADENDEQILGKFYEREIVIVYKQ